MIGYPPDKAHQAMAPQREDKPKFSKFYIVSAYGKMPERNHKYGWKCVFFSTNLDLANILGRTDLDFENLFFVFFGFQIARFPGPQKSGLGQAWAGPGLGWAGLGP